MYENEPWWNLIPDNIKEILKFYTWLRRTRLDFLKIVYGWYKMETKVD